MSTRVTAGSVGTIYISIALIGAPLIQMARLQMNAQPGIGPPIDPVVIIRNDVGFLKGTGTRTANG